MPPHRPERPRRRAFEGLSSEQKEQVRDIAKRMEDGEAYFHAVRQVLANRRITHQPDVERLIKTFSKPVDEIRMELQREDAERKAEEIDIEEAILEERRRQLFEDMEQAERERSGDPKD